MCPMWNAALECLVRSPSSAEDMRGSRQRDYDAVQAMPPRVVPRGFTSWESFQYPEPLQPAQRGSFQIAASARAIGAETWHNRTGTHLAA